MSQTSDRSIEERVLRLEKRQEAMLQKQDGLIEVVEQNQQSLRAITQLLNQLRPQSNDNDEN